MCLIAFFVPHNRYHSREMLEIARGLKRRGLYCGFVCIDESYNRDYKTINIMANKGFEILPFEENILEKVACRSLYVMNDWGGVVHELVKSANEKGLLTFGGVEGVNDFDDCAYKIDGVGRIRNPYKTVQYLFVTSKHDLMFFPNQKCYLAGIPRLDPLFEELPIFPRVNEVLINCNFTYGIYSDKRNNWIEDVVSGSQ